MQIQDSAKTPKAVFTISDVLNDSTKKAKLLGIIEEIVICKEIIRQQNDAIKDIQEEIGRAWCRERVSSPV